MLFNSLEFGIFFSTVFVLYFSIPKKYRWVLVLFSSYFFYMSWKAEYAVLIAGSTLVAYVTALGMAGEKRRAVRRALLSVSILFNLGVLFFFKYANFFSESVQSLLQSVNVFTALPELEVLLPVGISFYTFQTLAYSIDVYRGEREPERHLGHLALYVSFFPQLVAGPIERAGHLLPQLKALGGFDYDRVVSGLRLMLWGLFKKMFIADRLGVYVDQVFAEPGRHTGLTVAVALYFFAFQIYCDFSGYTDIARGAGRVFGIDLFENFRNPYFAKGIRDFWRRWHITLSLWFRDYVYIPLGGSRHGSGHHAFNLLVVFVVCGLWHGASWTFVVWGIYHGTFIIFETWAGGFLEAVARGLGLARLPRVRSAIAIILTFHVTCLGWLLFRAASFDDVGVLLSNLTVLGDGRLVIDGGLLAHQMVIAVASIGLVVVIDALKESGVGLERLTVTPIWVRWPAYFAAVFAILMMPGGEGVKAFIYFQF
jgi:D-alanyl-lipoteichoic acid acyltransferase DltB (MBOAT superfamily)